MYLIYIIQIILIILLGLPLLYLCILSFSALTYRKKSENGKIAPHRQFAIVIPAYNEEQVISSLMVDLRKINYPSANYDVFVIADNCTDKTAEVVRQFEFTVLERHDLQKRGKGHALHWGINQILVKPHSYDAVVILDADSHIYPNLLDVMNSHMEKGAEVIQGYITLKPEPGVWSSESTRLGYTLNNYVRALGRKKLGFPTTLKGLGMCFSTNVLTDNPWEAYSLTEDLEYGLQLLLKDIDAVFAPEVIGYALTPKDPRNAASQRERWEMGRYPVIRKYFGELLFATLRKRSLKYFDVLIDLVIPPLVNLMGGIGILIICNLVLWWLGYPMFGYMAIIWFCLALLGVIHVQIGLIAADADRSLYRVFAYVPRYALWKAKIYAKAMLKGRTKEWVRTSRE